MAAAEFDVLLQYLKAVADDTRLKLICLLSEQAYNVGELASVLELTEPTVSHHLSKLRELGLINLGIRGNKHYYKLNRQMLGVIQRLFDREAVERINEHLLSHLPDGELHREKARQERAEAEAWLAAQEVDDYARKVLKDYTQGGTLKQIPKQQKKLLAILGWLAQQFEPGVKYAERDVNALLKAYHPDYARLRRELINFHFLQREGGGGLYWRTPEEG